MEGFRQATRSIETGFSQITQKIDSSLQDCVKDVENGLRDALGEMKAKIEEEADKAADQVQPRWKSALKWVVIIGVVILTIVVAVVAGPAVIGAVGALAGVLVQVPALLVSSGLQFSVPFWVREQVRLSK